MTRQERDPERGTPTANEGTETSVEWWGGRKGSKLSAQDLRCLGRRETRGKVINWWISWHCLGKAR